MDRTSRVTHSHAQIDKDLPRPPQPKYPIHGGLHSHGLSIGNNGHIRPCSEDFFLDVDRIAFFRNSYAIAATSDCSALPESPLIGQETSPLDKPEKRRGKTKTALVLFALLSGAAVNPIWGKFSQIFGRKPILLLANATFLVGSLCCALSPNLTTLITGRVIQGMGSGGYGMLGGVWAIANTSGPFLGGVFAERLSWRWCFWINIPCDGFALILTWLVLDIHNPRTPLMEGLISIDWLGAASLIAGILMILIGIELGGSTSPWNSVLVICLIVFGGIFLITFFIIERRAISPCIPLYVFSEWSNLATLLINAIHGFVFIAGTYFLPIYFQVVLCTSPFLSGIFLFPFVIGLSSTSISTGFIIKKTGKYRQLITSGMVAMTLGFLLFTDLPSAVSWPRLVIYQLLAGAGVGTNFQSPMLALHASVHRSDMAGATSAVGFVRQIANAVFVDVFTTGGAASAIGSIGTLTVGEKTAVKDAYQQSLQKMWLVYACVGVVGLGLTDWVGKKVLSDQHEEAKTGLEEERRAFKERNGGKCRNISV